jgi:4-amino-4-deoxy-L-arabinose transferase-like glycosyltransferase
MFYWVLNIAIALWVFFDARSRKVDQPVLWAIGTCLLMIIVIPFYFAKRSLKDGEVREGGTGWNVTKYFAIFWTLFMFVNGVSSLMAVSDVANKSSSGTEQAGGVIGTFMGMGVNLGLWFIVIAGALVIGLFLKKSSIVEKGPTGALALEPRQP